MELTALIEQYQQSAKLIQERIHQLRAIQRNSEKKDRNVSARVAVLYQEHGMLVKVSLHLKQYLDYWEKRGHHEDDQL